MTERQRVEMIAARNELQELIAMSEGIFEKQLSYIAGGSLALSFVLVEKVVGDVANSHLRGLLFVGWVSFALCLLVNLWSQMVAANVHGKNKAEIVATLMLEDGEPWGDNCYDTNRCEKRKKPIDLWNKISICLLIGGLLLIIAYTAFNLLCPC